jgi:hypothetical protein
MGVEADTSPQQVKVGICPQMPAILADPLEASVDWPRWSSTAEPQEASVDWPRWSSTDEEASRMNGVAYLDEHNE